MRIKKIYIKGMHCAGCEKLLDSEFRTVKNVKNARVDRKKNIAEIDYENQEPDFTEIKKIAKKFGCDAFEEDPETPGHLMSNGRNSQETSGIPEKAVWTQWLNSILIVLAIFFIYRFFQNAGLINKIDFKGAEITYGISFLIGLVASISSCLAVVGAVVIAFGEKYKSEGRDFYQNAVRPNLLFHIGRLGTFFILGGALGLIGGEINISGNFISIFTIIVALIMGWLGLNILGILPSISSLGVRMPKGFTRRWDGLKQSEHKAAPLLLGGLSFFLPCGFTQSMQIFALSSGSFLAGGSSLFLFALGTMPPLLALGVTASWTRTKKLVVLQKVAGMIVMLFAIYTLQSGLALRGIKSGVLSTDNRQLTAGGGNNYKSNAKEKQTVEMKVTYQGFQPAMLAVKKGVPVKWIIKGDQVSSCTNRMVVPRLDIVKNIAYGDNVIEFTPTKTGEIPFGCWMGMVRGKFIVE